MYMGDTMDICEIIELVSQGPYNCHKCTFFFSHGVSKNGAMSLVCLYILSVEIREGGGGALTYISSTGRHMCPCKDPPSFSSWVRT